MLNFSVGPVQSNEKVLEIGGQQTPYFRTSEFSNIMKENERLILEFSNAPAESRVVFITGSGTASMEAVVSNALNHNDKVLVINGGSFGERFVKLCDIYEIQYSEIRLNYGEALTSKHLKEYDELGYTALLINVCETSTGVLYDMHLVSEFCKKNNILLIADCISSFLADSFDMTYLNAGVMITGSQKALACAPGVSIIVLNKKTVERIKRNDIRCLYLNLRNALEDMERGQTPFTPAVNTLLQINSRLLEIKQNGGVKYEIDKTSKLASYFRSKVKDFPFELFTKSMSNCVTSLKVSGNTDATDLFDILKNEYNIWICPNGGELKSKVFRIGHIGNLKKSDYDTLIDAFKDLQSRGILK